MKPDQTPRKDADALQTVEDVELDDQKHARLEHTDYAGAALKSDPEEIKLVRKLDRRIMVRSSTLLHAITDTRAAHTLCHVLSQLVSRNASAVAGSNVSSVDRNAIAQARLNNLEEDLNMTGTQFNTTVSILFVGYVLMQVPSNMMITKVRPSWYMSAWMLIWAAVSGKIDLNLNLLSSLMAGCTALVQNYGGLVACRFFLGITEAPFYPAATYVLSTFFTRRGMLAPKLVF